MQFRKINIADNELTDLVFENRNKLYGAYKLRKSYDKNVSIGLAITVSLTLMLFLIPILVNWLSKEPVFDMDIKTVQVDQMPPPPAYIELQDYSPPPAAPKNEVVIPKVTQDSIPEEPKPKKKPEIKIDTKDSVAESKDTIGGNGITEDADAANRVYYKVDILPQFPGGISAMHDFIKEHIVYPESEKVMNRQGRVYIACVVNKDGSLSDFKVARSVNKDLDEEALRVIKEMPKWIPGFRNKQAVRVQIQIPVTFSLKK